MKLEKELGWRWEGRIFETRDIIAKEDVGEWGLKEGESLLEKKSLQGWHDNRHGT